MKYSYNAQYFPSIPVIPIRLSVTGQAPTTDDLTALIDTGSDFTIIPAAHLISMDASPSHQARARGPFGNPVTVDVFEIDVWFDNFRISNVFVVSNEENDEILLGRNVLNKLILLLDGHKGETALFATRPKIRS